MVSLILALAVQPDVHAQADSTLTFERIATEQGLSFYSVTSILQDRQGFLWIGTQDGLNRYDGHQFTVFRHDPADSTSLSDSYVSVNALIQDQAGSLWIGTANGLNRRDPATGRIIQYTHIPGDPYSLSHDRVLSVHETQSGILWVGTERGLNRFDPASNRFVRYGLDVADSTALSYYISAILEDSAGTIWLGTRRGLLAMASPESGADSDGADYDQAQDWSGASSVAATPSESDGRIVRPWRRFFPEDDVKTIYEDRAGILWVGTWGGGLIRFDPATRSFRRFEHDSEDPSSLQDDKVLAIHEGRAGTLWIGTWDGGLSRLDPDSGRFRPVIDHPSGMDEPPPSQISSIHEDRSGVLWVGTWGGLYKAVPHKGFNHYAFIPGRTQSLSHPTVSAVLEDQEGVLWIGTLGGGLNRLDRETGDMTHYRHHPNDPGSLSHDDVTAVREDQAGDLWIATGGGGLNRLASPSALPRDVGVGNGPFIQYRYDPRNPSSLGDDLLYSVLNDEHGDIWIGTVYRGLDRFDRASRRFVHYRHARSDPAGLGHDSVWPLYIDGPGVLWIGTVGGGLDRFDPTSGTFTHFRHDSADSTSISSDRILSIAEDLEGNLWVGTMGGGVNRFDRVSKRFVRYSEVDGLAHSNAVCIVPDRGGNVWIGTSNGLSMFDPGQERFVNYGLDDGLPTASFYAGACHRSASGELFFGSYDGLVSFYPDRLRENQHVPSVVLTGFEIFNQPVRLDSSISHVQRITLPYDENFVGFEFAALDFTAPSGNRHAYKLEGLDDAWIDDGGRRYAGYPNLAPGRYVFRVKGANNDGLWNEEGASVRLIVTPPWWQTWWASSLYVLMVFALTAGAASTYARRQADKLEKRRLKQFFANISHEFRSPLTLIMGPLRNMLGGKYGPTDASLREHFEMMLRNSERLLRMINQILDLSKIEAGVIRLQVHPQDLAAFAEQTASAFMMLAKSEGIALSCDMPAQPVAVYFDTEYMEQVVGNLLSNAVKFSKEGDRVEVLVRETEESAEVVVRDTGGGIPADKLPYIFDRFVQADSSATRRHEGAGIGLSLVKELVLLHGGRIEVDSEVQKGSTFTVTLPLGSAHFRADQIVEEHADRRSPPDRTEMEAPVVRRPTVTQLRTRTGSEALEVDEEDDVTTVLVVDDNADMRAFLRGVLGATYRVLEAEDGKRGLECARTRLPDLVIADVMMPEMDGFALSRELKESPMTDCIPVVLLTARAAREDELEGLVREVDDYVRKPFDAELLLARVQNLIRLRQRLRDRFSHAGDGAPPPVEPEPDESLSPFLENVHQVIEEHLADPDFNVKALTEEVAVSYSKLYDDLRGDLEMTPLELIRTMRLERAARLLKEGAGNVSEVAYGVGFNSLSHFSKCFRKRYGMPPSEYARDETE